MLKKLPPHHHIHYFQLKTQQRHRDKTMFTMEKDPPSRSPPVKCSPDLQCNHTEDILLVFIHIKLPLGWSLLQAYSYAPDKSTGGPFILRQLTILLSSFRKQQKRDLQLLTPDCDSHTALFNQVKYITLAFSLISFPLASCL